jgi:hypothetical protein
MKSFVIAQLTTGGLQYYDCRPKTMNCDKRFIEGLVLLQTYYIYNLSGIS